MRLLTVLQAAAALAVVVRLARGRSRLPALAPVGTAPPRISVVIPARDEEARIGPCLSAVLADPDVAEVLVVDDESRDGTARLASELGAKVVTGAPLPEGWVGKQWALTQGVEAAGGDVVVTLDADTRPAPGLFGALAAALGEHDLVSAGPRFVCEGTAEQALHASFLATLVYRFGPIGPSAPPAPHRTMANGQCTAFRRTAMLDARGFARVRGHMADDVALARTLAADGWAVGFLDAGGLLEVDMHDSAAGVWREWGRSLSLRDVTGPGRQAADLAVIWLAAALPVLRLAAGRPTRLDLGLLAVRLLLAGALRGSYTRPGPGVLLSPLLDPLAALRLTQATLRPVRDWRGRAYPAATTASRLGFGGTDTGPGRVTTGGHSAPPDRSAAR
ncbi:glycosyltransferase [Streptosporangium sp. NBC_01495]|uniref:glycosyltransferase family 2 protein n=1 Tax=Streptosporangium sp. NBC_01495 TaxID=2903899 RepID=UPI002E329D6D|nr:glycosyltransferase family 2 protein [Streptosporangium sp. NBC_01495]